MLQMTNIITKCHRGEGKNSQSYLAEKFLTMYQHSLMDLTKIVIKIKCMRLGILIIIFNILYLWGYIYKTKTISISSPGF